MNQIECQFCNKVFGNNQMLRQHQKKLNIVLTYKTFFSENPQMTIKEYEKKADKQKINVSFAIAYLQVLFCFIHLLIYLKFLLKTVKIKMKLTKKIV